MKRTREKLSREERRARALQKKEELQRRRAVEREQERSVRFPLRVQFMLLFILLMGGMVLLMVLVNATLLERFYQNKKKQALISAYGALEQAADDGDLSSDDFDVSLLKRIARDDIGVMVMDEDMSQVKAYAMDLKMMQDRMLMNIYDLTPDISVREEYETQEKESSEEGGTQRSSTLMTRDYNSRYYVLRTLASESDRYVINVILDTRTNNESMEMYGTLSDNHFFLLRVTLESIHTSAKVANDFLVRIGLIGVLLGVLLAVWLSSTVTRPIREITAISNRMKKLDFSSKYTGNNNSEIGALGENINELSASLEQSISELKTANNELRQDIRKREEMEKMRQEFLASVTHELKTPLALISGYAEGLQDGIADDPDSSSFYCEVIVDEAGKMNRMVQKLLTLNQLEFGNTPVNMDRFDIVELVRNYLSSAELLATQKGIRVNFENPGPIFVWADEFLVEEVFMNYYSNAVNHADGERVINVRFLPKKDCVRVTVFNTGKQIPEDSLPHLWEEFYKVDKARTRAYGGSGVGLSIVRAIMNLLHQGYGVDNYENGVAFWFELDTGASPAAGPQGESAADEAAEQQQEEKA